MTEETNVLYGGPDVPVVDATAKSFGEVALKMFRENGDTIIVVSVVVVCLFYYYIHIRGNSNRKD